MLREILFKLDDRSSLINYLVRLLMFFTIIAVPVYYYSLYEPKISKEINALDKELTDSTNALSKAKREFELEKSNYLSEQDLSNPENTAKYTKKVIGNIRGLHLISMEESIPQPLNKLVSMKSITNQHDILTTSFDLKARTRLNSFYEFLEQMESLPENIFWTNLHYLVYDQPYGLVELKYFVINKKGSL